MAVSAQKPFRLSSLTWSVYLPTFLFAVGQGAVVPVAPLFARELGASVAMASLIVGMRAVGQMIFDMPAGLAVSRWGDKWAMVIGTALVGLVAVGSAFSPSPVVLAVLSLFMGGAWAFWQLARLAYVSEVAPVELRGRALSTVGGANRIGNFVGPLIGGFVGAHFGLDSAFFVQAVMGVLAALLMFVFVAESSGSERIVGGHLGGRLVETMIEHRKVFGTAGVAMIALGIVRQARQVFLPLWGDEIGLEVGQIGILTSLSFFIDSAVFYPTGHAMDRWGRKWAGVPCILIIAIGLLLLPLTHSFYSFMSIAILSGFGNGLGAGINMTLGADFAPPNRRGEFLGIWRVISDTGQAGGPMFISFLTGLGGLALASVASGGVGLLGAVVMLAIMPETLKRHKAPVEVEPVELEPAGG